MDHDTNKSNVHDDFIQYLLRCWCRFVESGNVVFFQHCEANTNPDVFVWCVRPSVVYTWCVDFQALVYADKLAIHMCMDTWTDCNRSIIQFGNYIQFRRCWTKWRFLLFW